MPIPVSYVRLTALLCMAAVLMSLTGCAGRVTRHNSSSAVQYLYPDQDRPLETAAIPRLSLPLRVGVAFVPESSGPSHRFTESEKARLLTEIASHFMAQPFVGSIEVLPSAYLTPRGSFANLDQIRTMHGVDVIVLVSYDQTQFTDEGLASITYWTLIGAYIVPGEKNDTHTMVDAVVYDIQSRKMLFRAPGVSHIKGLSTPVNLSEELRKDSLKGFQSASEDLIRNLDQQLHLFQQRVKERPQDYEIVRRSGYTGGGAIDWFLAAVLGFAIAGHTVVRSRRI